MPVITQIYTAQSPEEAIALANLRVDHVGITVSNRGLPGEIAWETGAEVIDALKSEKSRCVALTVETDPMTVQQFAVGLRPDILHLCGDVVEFPPEQVARLRGWLRDHDLAVDIMQAIPMSGSESVQLALEFEPYVDWLILDSVTDAVAGIGAAGVTHDWSLSRLIVERVSVPVILAGGLGPENVAEAIRIVSPAGVDSLTKTNTYHSDGSFEKDLDAVARFMAAAR